MFSHTIRPFWSEHNIQFVSTSVKYCKTDRGAASAAARAPIDSSVTKVISLFELAYSTETNKFTKEIIRSSVIEGNTDLESLHLPKLNQLSLNTYRKLKQDFLDKVYALCILHGLVSQDDILNG